LSETNAIEDFEFLEEFIRRIPKEELPDGFKFMDLATREKLYKLLGTKSKPA